MCIRDSRQAAQSAIVMNAHLVDRGEVPDLRNQYRDFFFLRRRDPLRTAETVVELVRPRLPEKLGIPADQIQVLSPTPVSSTHLSTTSSRLFTPWASPM